VRGDFLQADNEEHAVSLSPEVIERLPRVDAQLSYLLPMKDKPRRYQYDPPPGVPVSNSDYEWRNVPIRDIRAVASDLSLDREGAALKQHRSAVRDFYDDEEVQRVYYGEMERLVAEATGARRVVVFDHTVRRRVNGANDGQDGVARQPVPRVHNDYTENSGPQRVRDLLPDEADRLLQGRFAIINVWKPIRGPLQDAPLAVCDARSAKAQDYVATDLIYRDRVGETYQIVFNPAHRWLYASQMSEHEVLLIKCYDSARDGRARFTPHASFEDPTAPADMLPRESIEIRTLVFY
jgi:hypothetical protein